VEVTATLTGRGTRDVEAGKSAAKDFAEGLRAEWENLRHSITLIGLEVTGTDSQRLAAEEQHALNLLDIEQQQAEARHRLRELTDDELRQTVEALNVRRQIVSQTREQTALERARNSAILAGIERENVLTQAAIEMEGIRGELALARLGSGATIAQRLELQLQLNERIYEIRRRAIEADITLNEDARATALFRLNVEREIANERARGAAAVSTETQKGKGAGGNLKQDIGGAIASIAGSAISGGGVSGAQIGSTIGMLAGSVLPGGPIVGSLVAGLGGAIGGLFDKKKKPEQQPIIKGLDAIERAQRDTITTIAEQTDALLNPENRLLNLPSTFTVPRFNPGGGGTTVTYGDTNVTLQMTVSSSQSPDDIRRLAREGVEDALGEVLASQRRSQAW
jgi:hypothetical protein